MYFHLPVIRLMLAGANPQAKAKVATKAAAKVKAKAKPAAAKAKAAGRAWQQATSAEKPLEERVKLLRALEQEDIFPKTNIAL